MKDLKIEKNFWFKNAICIELENLGNRNAYFDFDGEFYDSLYETALGHKIDFKNGDTWYSASISYYPRKKDKPLHLLIWSNDDNEDDIIINLVGSGKDWFINFISNLWQVNNSYVMSKTKPYMQKAIVRKVDFTDHVFLDDVIDTIGE